MKKILSICIPSYNMEEYLPRCVDSMIIDEVLEQLEIIIVNDGSKDATLSIANEYKTRYPGSVVVIDKPNGHYGSCINASLKVATGKYFRIVDADDWVDNKALVELVHKLEELDVDSVCTKYAECWIGKEKKDIEIVGMPANEVLDLNQFILPVDCCHMHCLTYRTELLREIDYQQTEGVCYTDTEYVYFPLSCSRNFYFLDITLYQYFLGREGQSVAMNEFMKNNSHYIKIVNSIQAFHHGDHPFNKNEKSIWACMLSNVIEMSVLLYVLYMDYDHTKEKVFRPAMKELRQQNLLHYSDGMWSQNDLRVANLWCDTGSLSRLLLVPVKIYKRRGILNS